MVIIHTKYSKARLNDSTARGYRSGSWRPSSPPAWSGTRRSWSTGSGPRPAAPGRRRCSPRRMLAAPLGAAETRPLEAWPAAGWAASVATSAASPAAVMAASARVWRSSHPTGLHAPTPGVDRRQPRRVGGGTRMAARKSRRPLGGRILTPTLNSHAKLATVYGTAIYCAAVPQVACLGLSAGCPWLSVPDISSGAGPRRPAKPCTGRAGRPEHARRRLRRYRRLGAALAFADLPDPGAPKRKSYRVGPKVGPT